MTKISSDSTQKDILKRYGISKKIFEMLLAVYKTYESDVLFNLLTITAKFRISLASWAIRNLV